MLPLGDGHEPSEDFDTLSRKLGVTAATLSYRRDQVLAADRASLKSRLADDRDEEIRRLRAKIGEITMAGELLVDRSRAAAAHLPLAWDAPPAQQ